MHGALVFEFEKACINMCKITLKAYTQRQKQLLPLEKGLGVCRTEPAGRVSLNMMLSITCFIIENEKPS